MALAAHCPPLELASNVKSQVYVIDDDSEVRKSLHLSLAASGTVGWPFISAHDFLDQVHSLTPAPILLDVRMPGMDGLELLTALRDREIDWPVIMMSAHGDVPVAVRSIRSGALDFLEKPFKFAALEELLTRAGVELVKIRERASNRDAARLAWKRLTAREAQVLELLIAGLANKSVANALEISVRTVEIHRGHALAKLGVKSLAQVVSMHFASQ